MPTFKTPWEYAFPSGHINATYCTGSIILLFLKNKQNNKINWKIKLCFIIWLIHVLAINFVVVMESPLNFWHCIYLYFFNCYDFSCSF
ncbi:hypothetical protein [Spiroplasma sp. Moj]|uniref:hypothetical protein n=1 Tax=Spiroplasma sp. Moj TaxID=1922342 RepID=UPI0039EE04F5